MALSKIGASIVLEGEKEYRQALKNITTDQKELKSEMQLANATFADNQDSLEALTAKYDILNKQLETQQNKVDVYAQALEAAQSRQSESAQAVEQYSAELEKAKQELDAMKTSGEASNEEIKVQEELVAKLQGELNNAEQAYNKNTAAVSSWQTGLNYAQADLSKLQGEVEKTGQALEEVKNPFDRSNASLQEFGDKTEDASQKALSFGDVLKANVASEIIVQGFQKLADLAGQVAEGMVDMATNAAYFADDVKTLSTQTGVATDTIQALYYSEKLLDVSVQTVTSSMAKNVRAMSNAASGSEKYEAAYKRLGVAVQNADGSLRDSEEVYWEVIDALKGIDNATERDALAMDIFGKSAQSLNTLIQAGSEGFQALKEEATDLGYVMEDETIDALVDTSDALERLSKLGDTVKNQLGVEMADTVTEGAERIEAAILANKDDLIELVSDVIPPLVSALETIIDHADEIIPILGGMTAGFIAFKVGTTIVSGISAAMAALQAVTEGTTIAQLALNAAQNASPWGWIAAAIGGVVTALVMYIKDINEVTDETSALIEKNEALIEQEREFVDAKQETIDSRKTEQATIESLKDELLDLNSQQTLSNDEQSRMASIVDQLNGAMPDLNLALDEETGHLTATNAEIEKQIENRQALLLVQAAEADMADIANQIYDAEKAKNEILEQSAQSWQNAAYWEEQYENALNNEQQYVWIDDVGYSIQQLEDNYNSAKAAAEAFDGQAIEQEGVLAELQGQYDAVSATMTGYQSQVATTSGALEEQANKTVLWRDRFVTMTGDTVGALQALETEYAEAKKAAEESLGGQIGLFEELSGESELTVGEMATNLQSQTDVMNQYADDMTTAMQLVEDGMLDEGLLGSIQQMGIEGAGYLHELVTAAEEDTDAYQEVMDAWTDQQVALDRLAGQMADFETDYTNKMDALVTETIKTDDDINQDVAETMGELITVAGAGVEGMAKAILDGLTGVQTSSTTVAEGAVSASQDVLGIDSSGESSTGKGLGQSFADGIKGGIEAQRDSLVDAVNSVMQSAIDAANAKALELNRALGGAMD